MIRALAALLLIAAPYARAAAVDDLLAKLDAQSRAVETMAGEFVQKNRVKIFKQELTSRGRFYFQRPRRIRWEYVAPDPSTMVLDGDTATLRTPGAAPQTFDLQRDPVMRTVFDQLLLWLGGGGLVKAKADHDLAASGTVDAPVLVLTPRTGSPIARAFARIELRFDKALALRRILLREPSGDEKEVEFVKLERNGKLPKDAFKP